MKLEQTLISPRAAAPVIFYRGDQAIFRLYCSGAPPGKAFLRTNHGMNRVHCDEAVEFTETGALPAGRDWRDLAMHPAGSGEYELILPLNQVGLFEGKAGWRADADDRWYWPEGGNLGWKVEPAESVGANLIYTAFVRQFRPAPAGLEPMAKPLDEAAYTVIPPSGTFRDLIRQLDFILGELGSRILQLLPIHPTPTVYGRMGRYGSPFASLDYFAVNPELAEFDPAATPLEQFMELVDAVHLRHGRIFLDIPVNHTGWGSRLAGEHPEWFVRKPDGTFESPGAWGVTWADLCKLDYNLPEVHQLMARVFLYWCRHGVDGFRCDAGYMLPEAAWKYIVSRVRREFPDVIFLLEGLGGPLPVQERLLGSVGLDWAYSELFQNYDYDAVKACLAYDTASATRYGLLVNFAETHDNSRLAAVSPTWSRTRLALCALSAANGAFGFANGVEWLAAEQIDVHGNKELRWGATDNLVVFIRKLQKLLAAHPAFYAGSRIEWIDGHAPVVMLRRTAADGRPLLALVNLDQAADHSVSWDRETFEPDDDMIDFFTGVRPEPRHSWHLEPGGCAVLLKSADAVTPEGVAEPERVVEQRRRLLAQRAWVHFRGDAPREMPAPEHLSAMMQADYGKYLRRAADSETPPCVLWRVPADARREVVLANGDLLCVSAERPFRATVWNEAGEVAAINWSVPDGNGKTHCWHTGLPANHGKDEAVYHIQVALFTAEDRVERHIGLLRLMPEAGKQLIDLELPGGAGMDRGAFFLGATRHGGMAQVRARWGEIGSKYDAWLAANIDRELPRDRRVMLTRVRAWVVVDAYSQALNCEYTVHFSADARNLARWRFAVPIGSGRSVELTAEMALAHDRDAVRVRFLRHESESLPGNTAVKLILRPDIDDRINHQLTKAYAGAEKTFPRAVTPFKDAFEFLPAPERKLRVSLPGGHFVSEPEWHYMVGLDLENYYGQDAATDLFSPGWFETLLEEGVPAVFEAAVNPAPEPPEYPDGEPCRHWKPGEAAREALHTYVVRRGGLSTVIAGYPWFLDWGRDTLIALRGLAACGMLDETRAAIRQFASFEDRGTIPNVISGEDVSNRDTSDAPLWLFVAVSDYLEASGDRAFLDDRPDGKRTLAAILRSIADHYRTGTPNGIRTDPTSGLVFSPAHFTWMDTNYPAASPRQGYPVEIQALWHFANRFLGEHGFDRYLADADAIAQAIEKYFFIPELDRYADCLHAEPGMPAAQAARDDAVRPNQLFLSTLGAVTRPQRLNAIVLSAGELVVPGGIRSLSDRQVTPPLPVFRDGRLLNDPDHPYRGRYCGPEDTERKVAYHNGTAWCWPFPSYAEALVKAGGSRKRALSILYSGTPLWRTGALGQLPEVLDGDAPHTWGGCGAQAWSVSEFYRVHQLLHAKK